MKAPLYLAALIACILLSGCETTRVDGSGMTYAEWKEKTRLEAEAKKRGIPFVYKTRAQIRKEAEEMRAIQAEVMGSMVKAAPVGETKEAK